jgi:hypothetical protein
MCLSLLQMKEKVASQVPGLAVVRTQRELVWVGPYVSERDIVIINLVIELGRNGRARDQGSHVSVLPWIEAIIEAVEGVCGWGKLGCLPSLKARQ